MSAADAVKVFNAIAYIDFVCDDVATPEAICKRLKNQDHRAVKDALNWIAAQLPGRFRYTADPFPAPDYNKMIIEAAPQLVMARWIHQTQRAGRRPGTIYTLTPEGCDQAVKLGIK